MFQNYLKIALRNLIKHRGYAFTNIFGLGIGIAATILILLYARHELTYDQVHKNARDVYLVYKERITPTGTQNTYDTWVPLLQALKEDYPAIISGTREITSTLWVRQADQEFQEEISYVDPEMFGVFTLPLVEGNASNPLPDKNSVVISREMAQKYFGDDDPIGRTLTIDFRTNYSVSGVLKKLPENSSINPDFVVPISSASWYDRNQDNWGGSFLNTYVQLAHGASAAQVEGQFPPFIKKIWGEEVASRTNFRLLPLLDLHATQTGSRKYAYILLGIAFATMLIASINFMNIATARSLERAREIGMRKVLGAMRAQLIKQYLGEAFLISLLAMTLGIGLAELFLPKFNQLYNLHLDLDLFTDPLTPAVLVGLALVLGMLSGWYPAMVLSRFRPVESLRGKLQSRPQGLLLRHGLVVVQFALSIILIVGTVVVWDQINHMKNAEMGFNKENIVVVPVQTSDFANPDEAAVRLETFKQELARQSSVISVTSSSHVPGNWSGWFTFAWPQGGDPDKPMRVRLAFMDARYFETYGMKFKEGRNFIENSEVDREESVIINNAALQEFGWQTATGKTVRRGETEFRVIGVVEDYNFQSLETDVKPILHFYRPPDNGVHNFISIKIKAAQMGATIGMINDEWNRLAPSRALNYFFADQNFSKLYQTQERLVAVAGAFSALAILIACLGLFGLAALMVTQRTKEIGVRKVLGATVPRIVLLLSKEYAGLVLLAFVVACPVAYFVMNRWLQEYAYRINIGVFTFVLAGILALTIAVLTVSYQVIRAALINPVDSLRYE